MEQQPSQEKDTEMTSPDRKKLLDILNAYDVETLDAETMENYPGDPFSLASWHAREGNKLAVEQLFIGYLGEERAEELRDEWEVYG